LDYSYGIWIGLWAAFGSIGGMYALNMVVKKFNRQSPIVMILAVILGLSAVLIPIFAAIDLVEKSKSGENIFEFSSPCS